MTKIAMKNTGHREAFLAIRIGTLFVNRILPSPLVMAFQRGVPSMHMAAIREPDKTLERVGERTHTVNFTEQERQLNEMGHPTQSGRPLKTSGVIAFLYPQVEH